MGKVRGIGISKNIGSEIQIQSLNEVEAIAGKGLINDKHFKDGNEVRYQITLIEIENINHYNQTNRTSILPKDFRRNIITEGIKLNELVGKELIIGEVRVKAHDLCRPCKYLEESLKQKNIVKEFLYKGGLRCEILADGKIFIGDIIK